MKRFLTLLLVIFVTTNAWSLEIIGTVIDKDLESKSIDEKALIAANVVIKGTFTGTTTDFNGDYKIEVTKKTGTLVFSYAGYKQLEVPYSFEEGETQIRIDAALLTANLLDDVVVSASRYEKKLGEETVSIDVIKPEFMGNQNLVDADEALAKSPGVTMIDGQANIRGGSGYAYGAGSRVLLLQDDMPIFQADAGRPTWSSIPVENIGEIEIIKGAASALYGSSAMNGVVNIKTAFPKNQPETYISIFSTYYEEGPFELNSDGEEIDKKWWQRDSLTYSGVSSDTTIALDNEPHPFNAGISFSHRRKMGKSQQMDFVIGGQYFREQRWRYGEQSNRGRLNGNFRYRIKDNMQVGLGYTARYAESGTFFLWRGPTGVDKYLPNNFVGQPTQSRVFTLAVDPYFKFFDNKGNTHKVLTRYLKVDNYNDPASQDNFSDFIYGEYQYQRRMDSINLVVTAGIAGSYNVSQAPLYGSDKLIASNISFYAQADKKFFDKLNVSVGMRVETNRISETKRETRPVGRFGLNYQAHEATYIRASFGQGYRFPTIAEKFIQTELGGDVAISPNPDLVSESGLSAELGLKQGWQTSNKAFQGFLDVALFYMRYNNMMEFNARSSDEYLVEFTSQNVGNTFITGIETNIYAQGKFKGFPTTLILGYTFIDPKFQVFDLTTLNGGIADYNVLKYRFRHTFTASWDIDFNGFTFGTTWQYFSFMENIDAVFNDADGLLGINFSDFRETRLKDGRDPNERPRSYRGDFILDLRVGYHTKNNRLRLTLTGKNLANREYALRPGLLEATRSWSARIDINLNKF